MKNGDYGIIIEVVKNNSVPSNARTRKGSAYVKILSLNVHRLLLAIKDDFFCFIFNFDLVRVSFSIFFVCLFILSLSLKSEENYFWIKF